MQSQVVSTAETASVGNCGAHSTVMNFAYECHQPDPTASVICNVPVTVGVHIAATTVPQAVTGQSGTGVSADYSGAMVLQVPLDVACHVALQMQPVSKHRLWKHMQSAARPPPGPVMRVVSMTANKNNRCAEAT